MTPRFARLAPSAVALLVVCACGKAAPRNLLLVSIDTLRADRIGAYGYQRGTSPAMDRLAARGVRFETVIADSNWTLPSHMTLFTGRAPSVHGVTLPAHRLASEVPTLAELLRARGYRTAAFTGGGWVLGVYGFARGFERYEDHGLDFPTALELAERKIRDFATDDRFFIFVHTYEVHCPYDPPSSYAARFRTRPPEDELETRGRCGNTYYNTSGLTPGQAKFLSDRYDASIRYADDLLAGFLERLEAGGHLSDTLVVVLSDHGEEFLEHGRIGHRATQYIESLRIPWIMVGPGLEPRVVQEPAGLADVMPTVLGLLRIPPPPSDGVSLLRVLQGRDADHNHRALFSENDVSVRLRSVVLGDYQLIVEPTAKLLFDWHADPLERQNLFGTDPERDAIIEQALATRLARLAQARASATEAAPVEIDDQQRERLRGLGYVE